MLIVSLDYCVGMPPPLFSLFRSFPFLDDDGISWHPGCRIRQPMTTHTSIIRDGHSLIPSPSHHNQWNSSINPRNFQSASSARQIVPPFHNSSPNFWKYAPRDTPRPPAWYSSATTTFRRGGYTTVRDKHDRVDNWARL